MNKIDENLKRKELSVQTNTEYRYSSKSVLYHLKVSIFVEEMYRKMAVDYKIEQSYEDQGKVYKIMISA